MQIDFGIEQLKDLEKKLKHLPDKGKALLSKASSKGSELIQRKLITAYPINNKNNIHIRDTVKIKKAKIDKKRTYQTSFVYVGSKKAPYAMSLEWGRKTKKGRSKAGEYAKKTKDEYSDKASDIMIDVIIKGLGLR